MIHFGAYLDATKIIESRCQHGDINGMVQFYYGKHSISDFKIQTFVQNVIIKFEFCTFQRGITASKGCDWNVQSSSSWLNEYHH